MEPMRASELLRGLGTLPGDPLITSVQTDSRAAAPGCLFVCIKGERADGHDFAKTALAAGAAGVLAQHPVEGVPADRCVLVHDPLDAMIALGGNYRARYAPKLVGVTGSVGKTTTKEFCFAVLSAFGKTLKTEGNQNNELGVPNTLLRLDDSCAYAVVEMGMQGLGEIRKLTLAARPCAAVVTCIGTAHLQQLGTRENICKAKLEICEGLPADAPLVLNGDDDFLPAAARRADLQHLRPVFFALKNPAADVRAENLAVSTEGTHFTLLDREHGARAAFIPAMGAHNVLDALSAYALATRLGLDPARAAVALADYRTTGHRQHIVQRHGVTVIEDCYNANPDSMRAALTTLAQYPAEGRRIAVLGDMFELGAAEGPAHAAVGRESAAAGVQLLLTVGEAMRAAHATANALGVPAQHCASRQDAAALLAHTAAPGDVVLVKASHGMQFEKLLDDFYAALDAKAGAQA